MLKEKIHHLSLGFYQETVANRRHIHQNPELSFQEKNTARYISQKLTEYGIAHQTNIGGNGIVGLIGKASASGKCIALRADMDALPIQETNSHDFISKNPGIMHACGHDAHTSMLLTAARILKQIEEHLEGQIKLIFQPAEEKLPGGAVGMIDAGVLKNPEVQRIVGQHVFPGLEAGLVGFRTGAYMASADEITIRIKGKGGHAAMPDQINDTVLTAAHLIVNLQQVTSRFAPPVVPSVLSFGKLIAEGAFNIIPDEVLIQGTFRTFDENWRAKAKKLIRTIATNTVDAVGMKADVFIEDGYPFLMNEAQTTLIAKEAAITYLGADKVVDLDQRMTAEDFAWYSQYIPATFYRIGTANKAKGINSNLHTSTFDIDEESLLAGPGLMAWIAVEQLKNL
ncbi:MAG: amidohydrolase [Bacteroidales bacterium]|jgi:amidohydrolase|nr:amidohydrolase [Bacteroidales bacterium]HOI31912.1 amidohydrolase [Bacteroidales bacterium]